MLKKIAAGSLIAFYVFLFFYFRLWDFSGVGPEDLAYQSLSILTLAILIAGMLGALLGHPWERLYIITANIAYLGFGVYLSHFRWAFWLFEEPTLKERIRDTAPFFLFGVVLPLVIIVLLLITRKKQALPATGVGGHIT